MSLRRKRLGVDDLPIPEGVWVRDRAGSVVAWDPCATHTFLVEQGHKSDCDDDCRANDCILPALSPVFRHMIAAQPSATGHDQGAVDAWLDAHPHPIVVVPGHGGFAPLPRRTVTEVVQAVVGEGLL